MSCSFEKTENGRMMAVLSFKRDQLIYDVENYAYIEGSIMKTERAHERHTVQDAGQEGNKDRISRVLDLYVAQARELLYVYTKHKIRRPWLNNILKDPAIYGIVLDLPVDFSQTTLNLLERLIHEYIVCGAVADWMSITNPEKAEIWLRKSDGAKEEIQSHTGRRMSKTRRKLSPF